MTTRKFNKKIFKLSGYINKKSNAKEALKRMSNWSYGRITQDKDGIYQLWTREKKN